MSEEIEKHVLEKYEVIQKLGRGAYGIVWKVKEKRTGKLLALKKVYDAFQNSTDAQRTYREVMYLKHLNGHENIIKLLSINRAYNNKDLYMVFDLMETDLHIVIRAKILKPIHKQFIMYQLFKSLKYIHSADLIHRDLKPSNMLINSDCLIKLADFGLARSIANTGEGNPVVSDYIATRWYRAPEILLGSQNYSKAVDIWSAGCIMAELLIEQVLFSGKSSLNQMELIVELLGRPTDTDIKSMTVSQNNTILHTLKIGKSRTFTSLFSKVDQDAVDLIRRLLIYQPNKRLTTEEVLRHPYFKQFHNPNEEISCNKKINIPINDNNKLSLKAYREAIYGMCTSSKSEMENSTFTRKKTLYPSMQQEKTSTSGDYLSKLMAKKKSLEVKDPEKEKSKLEHRNPNQITKKLTETNVIFSKKLSKENITRVPSSKSGIFGQKKNTVDLGSYNVYKSKGRTTETIFGKSKGSLQIEKKESLIKSKIKPVPRQLIGGRKSSLTYLGKKNSEGVLPVSSNKMQGLVPKSIQIASSTSKMSPYFMFKSKIK